MLGITLTPAAFLARTAAELGRIDPAGVQALSDAMYAAFAAGRLIFVIGNGGSGSNASHFTEDVGKQCPDSCRTTCHTDTKKRVRILSLTDNTAYITAWANDEGFDRVFVEQLKNLATSRAIYSSPSAARATARTSLRRSSGPTASGLTTFGVHRVRRRQTAHARRVSGLHIDCTDMGLVETLHLAAFHWVVGDMHRRVVD